MSETTDDKPAAPCKHCRGQPYDPRHVPGRGKTHDYEPAVRPPDAGDGRAAAPTPGDGDGHAGVRWEIGTGGDDEPDLLLVADNAQGMMVARSSRMGLALLRELVNAANAGAQKAWASAVGDAVVAAHVEAERDEWRRRAESAERLDNTPAAPVPAGYVLVPKVRLDQLLAYEMLAGPAAGAPRDGERREEVRRG